jgi:hypothetical protein
MAFLFTTTAKVRREAGFAGNDNLDDTDDIAPHIADAEAEVLSSVAQRYSLPLSANSQFSGSPAESLLSGIATQLAAAFVRLSQHDHDFGDDSTASMKILGRARGRLKKIEDGRIILVGADSSQIPEKESSRAGLSGFPSDATDRKFSMSQEF